MTLLDQLASSWFPNGTRQPYFGGPISPQNMTRFRLGDVGGWQGLQNMGQQLQFPLQGFGDDNANNTLLWQALLRAYLPQQQTQGWLR